MRRATRGQVFLPGRALAARFDVAVPVVLSVASRHVFALSADCCTSRLAGFPESSPWNGHKHVGVGACDSVPTPRMFSVSAP